ncbi:MAG: hypothetical protein K2I71_03535, partial [Helicobacter sp.]|nr:hypothetical protein [Helicobacter sp.]
MYDNSKKNVLIYGFGWSGKAVLHLCESFGLVCKIVDDGLEIFDDDKFLTYDSCLQNSDEFAIFLIAISGKPKIAQKIYDKLRG